jgi:hypothetical protein
MDRLDPAVLYSKVLMLDLQSAYAGCLKPFCRDHGLIGIRPQPNASAADIMAVLRSNVDLGGIMLFEHFGGEGQGLALARDIHAARPELPIFLRRAMTASLAGLAERDAAMFCCAYALPDLAPLAQALDAAIFSRYYPNAFVRTLAVMTREALADLFPGCEVDPQTPCLAVKDRTVYGEMFTLIAIESAWCRGYMMLQVEEAAFAPLLDRREADALAFRELASRLGEATNRVWGAFRNRYAALDVAVPGEARTQVPIVVNHERRHISFGSDDPQLCLKYLLRRQDNPAAPAAVLVQRLVFNLFWAPDAFRENPSVESLVEAGELELF